VVVAAHAGGQQQRPEKAIVFSQVRLLEAAAACVISSFQQQ
jgi:hypothetical protein